MFQAFCKNRQNITKHIRCVRNFRDSRDASNLGFFLNYNTSVDKTEQSLNLSLDRKTKLLEICKENEERCVRQEILYDEYSSNIRLSKDKDSYTKIILKDLALKYNFKQINILEALYDNSIRYSTNYSNPFDLPKSRLIETITNININTNTDQKEIRFKNLVDAWEDIINRDTYGGIQRTFIRDTRDIILKKGSRYDFAQFESDYGKNEVGGKYNMYEIKDPNRVKGLELEHILVMAEKYDDNFIESIGDVRLHNFFNQNDNYVYDYYHYDYFYGKYSFDRAIISLLDKHLETYIDGKNSIRYKNTLKTIRFSAREISCNKFHDGVPLEDIIYKDFVENTSHSLGDTRIEIGKLMDMYQIKSHDLLYEMYDRSRGGIYENKLHSVRNAKHILERFSYYIDYLYGMKIKTKFRMNKGESQYINIKKIESGDSYHNPGHIYRCIMHLMLKKYT